MMNLTANVPLIPTSILSNYYFSRFTSFSTRILVSGRIELCRRDASCLFTLKLVKQIALYIIMILSLSFFSTPYLPLRTDGKGVYVTRTQNACQMYGDPYTGHAYQGSYKWHG